ncbi:MAG: DUF5666 domain-containing protein [Planctomycetota bacterium]
MKKNVPQRAALSALALVLAACGGGGGGGGGTVAQGGSGGAGIGGSGYRSNGTITEFGSIFVNGIEFDTSSATFEIEDGTGSQANLQKGMRVVVEGSVNAGGTTGVATRVRFEDQLEGPIPAASTITTDADGENKRFTILGVPVTANQIDTTFVGVTFASLAPGQELQISGFFDAAGLLHATAIVSKGGFTPGASLVEAKGTVTTLGATTFSLRVGTTTLTVDYTSANLSQVPGGLLAGQSVEAKGTIASDTATTIVATQVKLDDTGLSNGNQVELEGIVTSFSSAGSFAVDGQTVSAAGATLTPTNLVLRAGIRVEVEGSVQNGVLQATRVKLREGNNRVHATASNVSGASFVLTVAGQTVRVTADSSTRLEDKTSGTPLTLATLNRVDGRFLEVRGYDDGTGTGLIATRIEIENPDDVILQGTLQSQVVGTSITVLGVVFPVDGTTEYQDTTNAQLAGGQTQFAGQVQNGVTLIRIKDKEPGSGGANPVGVADEVEIQTP